MDSLRELLPSAAVMVDQQPLKYTDAAQNTKPARAPAFLSVEEIKQVTSTIRLLSLTFKRAQVHTAQQQIQPHAGVVTRDVSGAFVPAGDWTTTYLHTDSQFQTLLGGIVTKIAELAWRVDKEQVPNTEPLHNQL